MKVVLAYKSGRAGAGDYFARMMPVGLGWINATLRREGYDSSLANLSGMDWPAIRGLFARARPDLVGITLYTFNRHAGLRLAREARRANGDCLVVVGGPHATHLGDSILRHHPDVDAVALGEGEMTMLEIARAVRERRTLDGIPGLRVREASTGRAFVVRHTGERQPVGDLDTLPAPAPFYRGHGLDVDEECSFIITSRGCPARCTFCNTPDFWGARMRFRSPSHMLEEIRYLRDRLGILRVSIRDDTFTVHRQRIIEFCRMLIEARLGVVWNCQSRVNAIDEERLSWMRRAGCDHIQYGIESGSPRLLEKLAKDITIDQIRDAARATRRVGLGLSIYLISGIPGETGADYRETRALLEEIRPHDGIVAPLAAFPGTRIHEELVRSGRIDDAFWIRDRRATLYLMEAEGRRRSHRRLVRLCDRVGRRSLYTREEIEEHKRRLPDAFVTWLASGEAFEASGEVGAAIEEYEEILRFDPENPWASIRIGGLLQASGDRDGAALYYRRALRAAPHSRWIRRLIEETRRPRGSARAARPLAGSP